MDISNVSSTSSIAAEAAASTSDTLDQTAFLNLLTTQLQYQDPSNPQDSAEFVAQLAQFSSLEQLISANEGLSMLYVVSASLNNAAMTQLLGAEVTASSDQFAYDGSGEVEIPYDAAGAATEATITITDEDGNVVWSGDMGALAEGEGSFTWDGKDGDGQAVEAGTYSFSISATDADGESVSVEGLIHGEIDGMSYESGTPTPSIGDIEIGLADIRTVSKNSSSD
jgi:flagellar basal-body rod modification protein FlgD